MTSLSDFNKVLYILLLLLCIRNTLYAIFILTNEKSLSTTNKAIRLIFIIFYFSVYILFIKHILFKLKTEEIYKSVISILLTFIFIKTVYYLILPLNIIKLYIKGISYLDYKKPKYDKYSNNIEPIIVPRNKEIDLLNLTIDKKNYNILETLYRPYFNSLSDYQKDIILLYQSPTINLYVTPFPYRLINMFLNRDKNIPLQKFIYDSPLHNFINKYEVFKDKDVKSLRNIVNIIGRDFNSIILNSPPTPDSFKVVRGTQDNYFMDKLQKIKLDSGNEEYVYTSDSVVSTSFSPNTSIKFTTMTQEKNKNSCCFWYINIPKGIHGLLLNEQDEFILPIGSRFVLKNIYKQEELFSIKNMIIYEWDYLPPENNEYIERYSY